MHHEEYMRIRNEDYHKQKHVEKTPEKTGVDMVNSPPHYNENSIECIEAIQAATGDGFEYHLQGTAIKYLWRFRYKGKPLEDLKKARWYLDKLIEEYENK
jgi:hypothetical protein